MGSAASLLLLRFENKNNSNNLKEKWGYRLGLARETEVRNGVAAFIEQAQNVFALHSWSQKIYKFSPCTNRILDLSLD